MESVRNEAPDGKNSIIELEGTFFPNANSHYEKYGRKQYEKHKRKEILVRLDHAVYGNLKALSDERDEPVTQIIRKSIMQYLLKEKKQLGERKGGNCIKRRF
jgi:hypothetical protein